MEDVSLWHRHCIYDHLAGSLVRNKNYIYTEPTKYVVALRQKFWRIPNEI